ncbi:DNA repair protein RadA [Entomospira entomophila]|uniref:DNA repair protein RadA n=1 Tax=Entomospira entomophila TaxID=2719988 RepID=A0A968GDE7_9SPIO|nr:DNA repair protein RadA [Entomospira entomophilus]NIZ40959.1 DNA repair protein RadA [Entomospira entomophilus]WDI35172.1 DNA repair protein RadA [Entomospira entomophilus]
MAKKDKFHYVCRSCGYIQLKWSGKCPECLEWNTLEEEIVGSRLSPSGGYSESQAVSVVSLMEVEVTESERMSSGFREVDQVLGGGIVLGTAILLGGEPGIGKSTLLLQMSHRVGENRTVLYISGEESIGQIKMRALRLGVTHDCQIYIGSDLQGVLVAIERIKPSLVIIDSIQTLYDVEIGVTPGTINQVKRCTHAIVQQTKEHDIALFLVAHVTKDGTIAGPKVVEHLVDTVLYFEQGDGELRLLRAMKNRFGAVDELGVFSMQAEGLKEMTVHLHEEYLHHQSIVGSVMAAVLEGTRVFFHEIQALVVPAKGNFSRIYSEHIDPQRIARMSAILEKYLQLSFNDYDIYMNVSGGVRLQESSIDLAIVLALYSARLGIALPPRMVASGELTLAGGIRWGRQSLRRVKFAEEMRFQYFLGAQFMQLPNSSAEKMVNADTKIYSLVQLMRELTMTLKTPVKKEC